MYSNPSALASSVGYCAVEPFALERAQEAFHVAVDAMAELTHRAGPALSFRWFRYTPRRLAVAIECRTPSVSDGHAFALRIALAAGHRFFAGKRVELADGPRVLGPLARQVRVCGSFSSSTRRASSDNVLLPSLA
jgi:hypothetical protein